MTWLAAYTGRELAAQADPFGRARQLGFAAIEIAGVRLPLPQDEPTLKAWSGRLESLDLKARFHCNPRDNRAFCSQDAAPRSACLERTILDIETAARLGMESVVIHPSAAAGAEERGWVIETLGALEQCARPLGVQLELECASGAFNGDPRELAGLCEAVPGVGIAMDVVHAWRSVFCGEGAGDLAGWINLAAPHIKSVQFNDATRTPGGFVSASVGRGDVPYDAIMPRLVALGCAWWTIELAEIKHLVESRAYLSPFLR